MQEIKAKSLPVKNYNPLKRGAIEDDIDDEWMPSAYMNTVQNLNESGNDSDRDKRNECPLCQKLFSRNAALLCHIKQNHSYMLQNDQEKDYTLASLKKEVLKWKNNQKGGKSQAKFQKSRPCAKSLGSEKDSGNESSRQSSESNCQEEFVNDFCVIGGTANSVGKSSFTSLLLSNEELLDPDESFSVIRKTSKKKVKNNVKKKESKSRPIVEKVLEKKIPIMPRKPSTSVSLDLSIDYSAEESKTLECFICHTRFSNSKLLTYHHMKNHMTSDCYQCSMCGSVYYNKALFRKHCSVHQKNGK